MKCFLGCVELGLFCHGYWEAIQILKAVSVTSLAAAEDLIFQEEVARMDVRRPGGWPLPWPSGRCGSLGGATVERRGWMESRAAGALVKYFSSPVLFLLLCDLGIQ